MVHFRIHLDGKPVPCWVSIKDSFGTAVVPMGWDPNPEIGGKAPNQWIQGNDIYCACNGGFEVPIQPGIHSVKVLGRPETLPWSGEIEIIQGQLAVRIPLSHGPGSPKGWLCADLRTHGLSPKAALIESEASGMALVEVLALSHWPKTDCEARPDYAQLVEFSGSKPALETPRSLIGVNTLNRHPILGAVSLLHSHRPVYPWYSGWNADGLAWSVHDWSRQCRRIKGVVIWPELDPNLPEYESIAALIHGDIDCVELCGTLGSRPGDKENRLDLVYALWNLGIACGIVGSSGKSNNRTRLGEKFTWVPQKSVTNPEPCNSLPFDDVMASIRKGEGSPSIGPFLTLSEGPGIATASIDLINEEANLEWINETGVIEKVKVDRFYQGQKSIAAQQIRNWLSCRLIGSQGEVLAHSPVIKGPEFGKTQSIWNCNSLVNRLNAGLKWIESEEAHLGKSLKVQLKEYFENGLALAKAERA